MQDKNIKPVISIALITAACLIGDSMLYIVLPTHWKEAGLNSLWEVGILLSVNRLVRLPLNPAVGWLYKKISSRNGIFFAAILAAFTTLSYGYVKGFLPLLMIRCIWGIAWTFLRLGAYFTILEFSNNSNRGHYMGTYNGLFRLGSLIGMLAGGFLADTYGIDNTAIIFSVITFITIPLVLLYVPEAKADQSGKPIPTAAEDKIMIWKDVSVLWVLMTGLITAMIYQGLFTATLSYLIQSHVSGAIVFGGIVIGSASLAGVLQALRWGWEPWFAPWIGKVSDGKCGRQPILVATLIIAGLLFALIPWDMPLGLWLLVLLSIQLTATVLTTIADAAASDVAACLSKAATVMTWYSFSIDLGAAIGPMAAYFLNEFFGTYAAYWGASGVLLLLALKWMIASPVKHSVIHTVF